ncbi:MAG: hypothetical protein ACOVMH_03135, partial [Flavobacterium sp.]
FCVFLFVGFKNEKLRIKRSQLEVITFQEGSIRLNEEGLKSLNLLALGIKEHEDFFEKFYLVIHPINSKKEFLENNCIGLERSRIVNEILESKYGLDIENNILIEDTKYSDYLFRNQTGITISALPKN